MKIYYVFIISILFINVVFCQIPHTISYQGVLTDPSGSPKPDGDYSITFSFYEAETGGDAIWTDSKTLNVSKGLFSTLLGDETPLGLNVKFDKPYFLGIKVGDENELSPRIALTSAGFSFSSIYSDTSKNIIDGKVVKSLNGLKDNVKIMGEGGTTVNTTGDTITISSSSGSGSGIQQIDNTNSTLDIINPTGSKTTINLKLPVKSSITSDTSKNIINGKVVKSINGLRDDVTLEGGGGTTINKSGNKITISSSTGSSGIQEIKNTDNTIDITNPNGSTTTLNLKVPLSLSASSGFPVISSTNSNAGDGIKGENLDGGRGIYGLSSSGVGVWGKSNSYVGIYGESNGSELTAVGVLGISASGSGVYGTTSSAQGKGVFGNSSSSSSSSDGVYGQSANGIGVHGYSGKSAAGVYGRSISGFGLMGICNSGVGAGIYAQNTNTTGYAGIFDGNVKITGTLFKSAGSFRIDHPLDPSNKYLSHSFVESPDMMNIYNGNVTTDVNGNADITLPDWFEALNKDFRYQLTVIGQFSQAIVESEIQNNQFSIRTDKPNVKVSWQVTGIRKDAYAKQHRIKVEELKPEKERGKYLHPELFGQPKELGIDYVKEPEEDTNPKPEEINIPKVKNP